ncbi:MULTISPECIES: glycosyltransferase [Elizabethkingia]|uniref:glycosyltransferase n=1 Tax=Elizabethkingia TaxID=308865 RepID=UPI0020B2B437|nr:MULTISPECIES: glycosyltransferase [Elizabethkingia]MDV3955456.1 glycosyl transferase [Elizabethkingia anophelis]UTF94120.1 glycosyltransferase [Elizabethkingia anophelis]
MKVLQIIDGLITGGAERLIVETVPLMKERGVIIDVLLLNGNITPFYNELAETRSCNIYSLGKSYYNPFYIFKIIPFLKRYDVVHVHLFPAQYFTVLAKVLSFSKTKLVFTEHNTENTRLNNPKFKWIEKWIYKYYKKIICITPEVKNNLKEKLTLEDEKLVVIQNGVNINNIEVSLIADRNEFGLSGSDKLLIMVAGFRMQKDQDTVIKTLKELPQEYKLLLVGDGERRKDLVNLINQLNLKERVLLLGNRSDVYSLLKMADIAILSSHWEGFGLAAVEAMACGIPVIASNVEGLAQVVDNGGILFNKESVEDLRSKILKLNNEEYNKEISERGMRKSKQYDIGMMVDKILNLYSTIK